MMTAREDDIRRAIGQAIKRAFASRPAPRRTGAPAVRSTANLGPEAAKVEPAPKRAAPSSAGALDGGKDIAFAMPPECRAILTPAEIRALLRP